MEYKLRGKKQKSTFCNLILLKLHSSANWSSSANTAEEIACHSNLSHYAKFETSEIESVFAFDVSSFESNLKYDQK